MSLPVEIDIASPDPAAAPTTLTQLIVLLRTLITAVVTGDYVPYVQGSETPAVSDQDKVWHRADGGGRPMGTYHYYSGSWRREYTHRTAEVVMYRGDPTADFDNTGLGVVGGEWDGFAIMNGDNGTEDWSDKFIVAARMTDLTIGFSGGTSNTSVSGSTTHSGGSKDITLDATNTFEPATSALIVGLHSADGNAPASGGPLYGSNLTHPLTILPADAGNPAPPAIPTLPPYTAVFFAQFVGYQ